MNFVNLLGFIVLYLVIQNYLNYKCINLFFRFFWKSILHNNYYVFSASQIDLFAVQQPGLETHLKNLNQGFSKYLERHAEIYEHDINRIGDLFTKLHVVVKTDTTTPGKIKKTFVIFVIHNYL